MTKETYEHPRPLFSARALVDSSTVHRTAATLRYRAKHWLGRRPRLYHWTYRLRGGYADRLVTDATDLCVEGFPRSANSFAVGAIEHAQADPLRIAHHNHVPAPILRAVDRSIPTIVLLRDPVEAVISNRGLQLQIGAIEGGPTPPHVPYTTQLRAWHRFYEAVWRVRDRVVVAPFEVVTDDVGRIVDAVNDRFGTDLARFEHTDEHVRAVRERRGYHALPSEQRDELKIQARTRFDEEVGPDHPVVRRTRTLRKQFVGAASVS